VDLCLVTFTLCQQLRAGDAISSQLLSGQFSRSGELCVQLLPQKTG
jgi:hypothetical protein